MVNENKSSFTDRSTMREDNKRSLHKQYNNFSILNSRTNNSKSRFLLQGSYRNRKTKFHDFSIQDFSRMFYIFSRIHFSYTVTHLTLLICRISFPFGILNTFAPKGHCFCLISALFIVSTRYFHFCFSRFPLFKISLPVAFNSYYMYLK